MDSLKAVLCFIVLSAVSEQKGQAGSPTMLSVRGTLSGRTRTPLDSLQTIRTQRRAQSHRNVTTSSPHV
ncbi:hypothetical protein PBY51_018555 [Eleginops maclovinus]|uniref:Uncharacterized protein n=1 Tax=Eleginops maclovinus TaxID=56733 RepID=A0AAN7Y7X8_ELEMC|nr:hypothetical protein PBY51_018555 [Eleginops maclovinus]